MRFYFHHFFDVACHIRQKKYNNIQVIACFCYYQLPRYTTTAEETFISTKEYGLLHLDIKTMKQLSLRKIDSQKVIRMTEEFMDELCVGVENELFANGDSKESYKQIMKEYKQYKNNANKEGDDSIFADDDDDDDHSEDSHDFDDESEQSEGKRATYMLRGLLFAGHPRNTKDDSLSVKPVTLPTVEPKYNTSSDANLDCVEFDSTMKNSILKVSEDVKVFASDDSVSLEATVDLSSSSDDEEMTFTSTEKSTDKQKQDDAVVEDTTTSDTSGKAQAKAKLEVLRAQKTNFPSLLDDESTACVAVSMTSFEAVANHWKQRRAIYLWSLSVLQRKSEKQEQVTEKNTNKNSRPQEYMDEIDTISRALDMTMMDNTIEDISVELLHGSVEQQEMIRLHAIMTVLKKNIKVALASIRLKKKIQHKEQVTQRKEGKSIGQPNWKQVVMKKAKSLIRKMKQEARAGAILLARRLQLEVHDKLSLLPITNDLQNNDQIPPLMVDVLDESISCDSSGSWEVEQHPMDFPSEENQTQSKDEQFMGSHDYSIDIHSSDDSVEVKSKNHNDCKQHSLEGIELPISELEKIKKTQKKTF
jgi:hypothetical protein